MRYMQGSKRRHALALGSMVIGSVIIFGSVLVMNELASGPDKQEIVRKTTIDFEKKLKDPPKKVVRQKKPKPRKSTRRQAPPVEGLATNLSGLDFGLPGLTTGDLGNLDDTLGAGGDVVMTDDTVDVPPRATLQTPMAYPAAARAKGVEGYVLLTVLISPTGDIQKVKVLESTPSGVFDEVAVSGVRTWRFEPASYQGRSVAVWAKQKVRFDLT